MSKAVRIRRRGGEGAVLNSKAEFNRCYIPRLRLEEKEEGAGAGNPGQTQGADAGQGVGRMGEKEDY